VLFLCSLISASLSAQQSASTATLQPVSDPQGVALVQRAFSALVGANNVSDVTLTGTARRIAGSDDETGTASMKATATGDSRVDLNFPSGERSEIRNHAATPLPGSLPPGVPAAAAQAVQLVGTWSGPDGGRHPIANHNLMVDYSWFLPALTLGRIVSSQNSVVSYVGQETRDGQQVVHVSVSQQLLQISNAPAQIATLMQHLSQMDFYLDLGTLLPVALDFNEHPDNNALIDIATEIRFSNYQAVNGVQVPFHVQRYVNNGLVLDLQFENANLNSGLAATAFQIQ